MAGPRRLLPEGAAEAYLAGETLVEVGQRFGVPPTTLRRRLVESGVMMRHERTAIHTARLTAARRLNVPEFEQQGRSTKEIAAELDVSAETVRRRMRERGQARLPATARSGHGHWKGGRTRDKDGYLLVLTPRHPWANRAGYVREHRLV